VGERDIDQLLDHVLASAVGRPQNSVAASNDDPHRALAPCFYCPDKL
jgi:hypothetical protein